MPLDHAKAKILISGLLKEISSDVGLALTEQVPWSSSCGREGARRENGSPGCGQAMRWLKRWSVIRILRPTAAAFDWKHWQIIAELRSSFFDTGAVQQDKQIFKGPDLRRITQIMPDLEPIIQARWLEAQRCQHAGAFLAAVIIMGSILEALLLARCSSSPSEAYQSHAAPKDRRTGASIAVHEWTLSTLIDVSVSKAWLKTDRGGFSHALRQSRNIVHPYQQAVSGANFDEGTCKVCWHVLNASVDDLLASI